MSSDVIRRARKTKDTRAADADHDALRRKERRRARRLREERNRRATLVCISSFALVAIALILFLRPGRPKYGIDSERFMRAKALRDAALSGWKPSAHNRGGKVRKNESYQRGGRKVKDLDGMRYLDPRQLPPLPGEDSEPYMGKGRKGGFRGQGDDEWQADAESPKVQRHRGPKVDYTKHNYEYPELMYEPPSDGSYPRLEPMSAIFETWGQDDLDNPPDTLVEVLQHFDYQDEEQVKVSPTCMFVCLLLD